jgi:hypothetical protein
LLSIHYEKIGCFTTRLELNFWNAMTICNSRYFYNWVILYEFAIVALNTPHHIWKCIFTKNMCNSIQLGATMLQLKYPNRFPMQNAHKWTKWLHNFHSSINKQNLLMPIATNFQLMHYQIIVLQLMDFANGIILLLL